MPPNNHKKGPLSHRKRPFFVRNGVSYLVALPKRKVKSMYAGRM